MISILNNYQTLIHDSALTASAFVQISIEALKTHVMAAKAAQKQKFQLSIKFIGRCEKLAESMAQESDKLVQASTVLKDLAGTALVDASKDHTISADQKRAILKQIGEEKEKEAHHKQLVEDLTEAEAAALKEEKVLGARADKVRFNKMVLSGLQVVVNGATSFSPSRWLLPGSTGAEPSSTSTSTSAGSKLGSVAAVFQKFQQEMGATQQKVNSAEKKLKLAEIHLQKERDKQNNEAKIDQAEEQVESLRIEFEQAKAQMETSKSTFDSMKQELEAQAESYEEREARVNQRRVALQKEKRETNAELKASVERLRNMAAQDNDLDKAVASLDVAIKTLGKVKTTFERTRAFWIGVAHNCCQLTAFSTQMQDALDIEEPEAFELAIGHSALGWLTLAKINCIARDSMQGVAGGVDNIMIDLPSTKEAQGMVSKMLEVIDSGISIEDAIAIENVSTSSSTSTE